MILLFGPATVLGPFVGWMRVAVMVPIMVAAMAVLELDGWPRSAVMGCCGAVLFGALTTVPNRWGLYLAVNFWFAATVVFSRLLWEQVVAEPVATVVAGLVAGTAAALADVAARQALVWLARHQRGAVGVVVHMGVWAGQVETTAPVLLSLAGGQGVMLWPGYRYVWRLSAADYAPTQADMTFGFGDVRG